MSSSVSNLYNYSLYTIEKDGKTVKLKPSQLTTQVIGKVFGLFPDSIILISDDGFVETPDHEGKFLDVDDLSKWVVNGDSLKADGLPQDQQSSLFLLPASFTSNITSNITKKRTTAKMESKVHVSLARCKLCLRTEATWSSSSS